MKNEIEAPRVPLHGEAITDIIKDWYETQCKWYVVLNEKINEINEALEKIKREEE